MNLFFGNKNSRGDIALYLILIFLVAGAFAFAGFGSRNDKTPDNEKQTVILEDTGTNADKKSLQLRTLKEVTPTTPPPTATPPVVIPTVPPATGGCPHYKPEVNCTCLTGAVWLYCNGRKPQDPAHCYVPASGDRRLCDGMKSSNSSCIYYCMGKPVIYLYPEKTTLVDVELTIPGFIYVSIPSYPDGGWKNVEAHPDGKLIYKGKEYSNLYYESQVQDVKAPSNGIFIKTANLKPKLTEITSTLGLNKTEQKEFLEYWLPKLYGLKKPYILFSLLDPSEKDRVDHVDINPKPATFIEFLAYFKGVDKPYEIPGLKLPTTPPKRIGFTAVEWGGTIEPKN